MTAECHDSQCPFHSCHSEDDGPFCYETECRKEEEDKKFREWVKSLPDTHWAKYDLSACRLGWDAGRALTFQERVKKLLMHNFLSA